MLIPCHFFPIEILFCGAFIIPNGIAVDGLGGLVQDILADAMLVCDSDLVMFGVPGRGARDENKLFRLTLGSMSFGSGEMFPIPLAKECLEGVRAVSHSK